jgi:UPF0755 protein
MTVPRTLRTFLVLILLLGVSGFLVFQDAQQLLTQPLQLTQKQRIVVVLGKTLSATLNDLQGQNLFAAPRAPFYLRLYARMIGQTAALKAGEYELVPGMSSFDLLALIVSGKTVLHELRLIEGWTFAEALAAVRASDDLIHTLQDADADKIMSAIGRPGIDPEGRFFPDTYYFPKGTTDEAFFRRASAAMDNVLRMEWAQRQSDLPYQSPEEALIMASIIEKETGSPGERAQVAGVFVRRLLKGMKLQTDPTVIYGLGEDFDGNLRRRDLEEDTPYNTYTRMGLPPTPICLAGRASIHAALHPAQGNAIYFVSRGDGTHQFSETLDQHNSAVQKFQLGGKRR